MTNQQHPITPPPELVEQWDGHGKSRSNAAQILATAAAQWGADQELEACCEWMRERGLHPEYWLNLRVARRPKLLSKADQALAALREVESSGNLYVNGRKDTIRLALEHLKELEQLND